MHLFTPKMPTRDALQGTALRNHNEGQLILQAGY